jgi:hypothetical protein
MMSEEVVIIPTALWKRMRFMIKGLAIMEVFKRDKPILHEEVISLTREIEKVEGK